MAYNLENRFPKTPKYFTLLDPGSYQTEDNYVKSNRVPFNSSTPRIIRNEKKLWTHAFYNPEYRSKIPNCSSMMSKQPRFPYESSDVTEFEEKNCECGPDNVCTCSAKVETETKQYECQGKVPKRIFKGPTKHSILGDVGLSVPSKNDKGFDYDGSFQRRLRSGKENLMSDVCTRPNGFATDFYRGWKWSRWSSPRFRYTIDQSPGPGTYDLENQQLDETQVCAEKFRFNKRRESKQLRFIEMIQRRNIIEQMPGPAHYNPIELNKQNIFFGSCARFLESSTETRPGPADHFLRRDFDQLKSNIVCHAKLPSPAPFNVRSSRFKPRKDFGPSPATYSPKLLLCNFMKCPSAPFGSSAQRFKEEIGNYVQDEEPNSDEIVNDNNNMCNPRLSSTFKSRTVRFKPLLKNMNEPSPADLAPKVSNSLTKPLHLQKIAPFNSSEGRFTPWNNYLSVFGKTKSPGPGYYDIEQFSNKNIAMYHGPLFRSPRFKTILSDTPAPNTYNVGGGVETVLRSYNNKLKENVNFRQSKYFKEPESKQLTTEEREWLLINRSINLLNIEEVAIS